MPFDDLGGIACGFMYVLSYGLRDLRFSSMGRITLLLSFVFCHQVLTPFVHGILKEKSFEVVHFSTLFDLLHIYLGKVSLYHLFYSEALMMHYLPLTGCTE